MTLELELELRRGGAEIGGEQIVTLFNNNDTKVLRTNISKADGNASPSSTNKAIEVPRILKNLIER